MTREGIVPPEAARLRARAEKRLVKLRELRSSAAAEDAPRLLHELQVHQIELEMQNEELQRSRDETAALLEKYLDLYDFAPTGYFTLDADGVILHANLTGATLLGVPRGELVGRRLALFLEPGSLSVLAAFLAEVMAGNHGLTCDVSLPRAGSEAACVQLSGEVFAAVPECRIVMVDVTESRKGEELRVEADAHRQAAEAIGRLNDQLREQVAKSLAANKELEAFSYSVSHDLRAPLRAINGFAALLGELRGEATSDEERRLVKVIRDNAVKMGCLIDDLILFARTLQTNLRRAPVGMKALVESVVAGLVPEPERARTLVRVADLPPAVGDSDLLGVAVQNLLANALKFSQGRAVREIEVGYSEGERETTYFVRDNGAGFDPRYKERLFGVFQRLHTGAEFEGTGIGLALVKRIVERHGGRVWAEGEADRGATFFFSLPRTA